MSSAFDFNHSVLCSDADPDQLRSFQQSYVLYEDKQFPYTRFWDRDFFLPEERDIGHERELMCMLLYGSSAAILMAQNEWFMKHSVKALQKFIDKLAIMRTSVDATYNDKPKHPIRQTVTFSPEPKHPTGLFEPKETISISAQHARNTYYEPKEVFLTRGSETFTLPEPSGGLVMHTIGQITTNPGYQLSELGWKPL